MSRTERAENTFFKEILMAGMSKLDGGGDGGVVLASSGVEFEAKV